LESVHKTANDLGKGSFKYAFLSDNEKTERERGITVNTHSHFMQTATKSLTIHDVPGHRDFSRTLLYACSLAIGDSNSSDSDSGSGGACIMCVGASMGEFEAGISSMYGQTGEHLMAANALGFKQVIIVVNKMDDRSINDNQCESRYTEIVNEIQDLIKKKKLFQYNKMEKNVLKQVLLDQQQNQQEQAQQQQTKQQTNNKEEDSMPFSNTSNGTDYVDDEYQIMFVPVSAWCGYNLIESFEADNLDSVNQRYKWYNSLKANSSQQIQHSYKPQTLMEAIERLRAYPLVEVTQKQERPFCMPIESVYKIKGVGTVCCGRVLSGSIVAAPALVTSSVGEEQPQQLQQLGSSVVLLPSGQASTVKTIEMHHQSLQQAQEGDFIGVCLSNISWRDVRRGNVLYAPVPSSPSMAVPRVAEEFTALVRILYHPKQINPGYTPIMSCHTACLPVKLFKLLAIVDGNTGKSGGEPKKLVSGQCALVRIIPQKPVALSTYEECAGMARFILRDLRITIGHGYVIKIQEKHNVMQ